VGAQVLNKIIGIAAPARSGKDTVASILLKHNHVAAYALADPLKIGCQALFGLSDSETWHDSIKEQRIPLWNCSPREFFQHIGTDWMRRQNPDHWLLRAECAINPRHKAEQPACPPDLTDSKAPFKLAAQAFFDLSYQQTWQHDYAEQTDAYWGISPAEMFALLEALTLRDFPDYIARRRQRATALPSRQLPVLANSDVILIKDIRFENEAEFLRRHQGVIWHIVRHDAEKVNAHASELGIAVVEQDVVIDNNGTLAELVNRVEQAWREHMHIMTA